MHKHRVKKSEIKPFTGSVSQHQNPAAHGCVTVRDECSCGAVRLANVNQQHIERGSWEAK